MTDASGSEGATTRRRFLSTISSSAGALAMMACGARVSGARDVGAGGARVAYDKIPARKEWVDIEDGHFGLVYWPSPEFDRASSIQARFLAEHLVGRR